MTIEINKSGYGKDIICHHQSTLFEGDQLRSKAYINKISNLFINDLPELGKFEQETINHNLTRFNH